MKITVSIKCKTTKAQDQILQSLRNTYMDVCNAIVPTVVSHRCWNRVALHHLVYHQIRQQFPLGSQMVCNAIFSVCKDYQNKAISKDEEIPTLQFRKYRSIHFDKRTYTMKDNILSLYTLEGRIQVEIRIGLFQLQTQIEYKALQKGLRVIYVNPAYSSQICSHCGQLGVRLGNTFTCSCGNQQHSDLNSSRNLCRFAMSLDTATCAVNRTQVAALVSTDKR